MKLSAFNLLVPALFIITLSTGVAVAQDSSADMSAFLNVANQANVQSADIFSMANGNCALVQHPTIQAIAPSPQTNNPMKRVSIANELVN